MKQKLYPAYIALLAALEQRLIHVSIVRFKSPFFHYIHY